MKHGDVGLVIDGPVAADSPTGLGSARTSVALSVGFAIAYAVAVLVGRTTRLEGSQLALVWPAAAVGFLWLAVSWGNRRHVVADAVTLTILAAAINGLTGAGPLLSVLFGLSNSVQAVMTCAVLFRLRPRALRLRDPADLTALVYGSVVGGRERARRGPPQRRRAGRAVRDGDQQHQRRNYGRRLRRRDLGTQPGRADAARPGPAP